MSNLKQSLSLLAAAVTTGGAHAAGELPGKAAVKMVYGPTEVEAMSAAKPGAMITDVVKAQGAPYAVYQVNKDLSIYRWGASSVKPEAKGATLLTRHELLVYSDSSGKVLDATYKPKGSFVSKGAAAAMPSVPF
jgi:hypothetical protein